MQEKLKIRYLNELEVAKKLIASKQYDNAFHSLEIAHILGQKYVIPHTVVHFYMLKVGILTKDFGEILGQLIRIPLGIIGSFIGIVPVGNTGGSNVSAIKEMEIPEDIREFLD